jgi:hypothetical protein
MTLPALKSPNRIAAMEVLNGAPSGHFARDIAAAIGMAPNHCATMLQNMVQVGYLESVLEGTQEAARRCRYYAPQHKETALAANAAGRGVSWGTGKTSLWKRTGTTKIGHDVHGKMTATGPAVRTSKTKVTIIQHQVDTRYTPGEVRPFFTQPGYKPDYLSQDTWAARAYGGQR